MTLVVATTTPDGVWMAADRIQGGFDYAEMAWSKIHVMWGPRDADGADRFEALVGFAGSARVAQAVLRLELPPRGDQPITDWMTALADTVQERLRDCGLMRDDAAGADEPFMAGGSAMIVAAEGHVFYLGGNLHWTRPAAGWAATGGAAETFAGAYEVHRDLDPHDPVEAARRAWPIAMRHHRIGPLADELSLPN